VTTERTGSAAVRVVSLLPAGTEIVAALGALDSLVGVSHECDFPAEVSRLPRMTASAVDRDASSPAIDAAVRALSSGGAPVFTLDADVLRRLAPSLILTQSLCEVCAVSEGDVRALADVLSPPPRVLPLVGTTLDGVWDDVAAVGAALGRGAAAAELLSTIALRLQRVHETLKAARAPRPRVAVIEWLDPVYAAGHWTPELVRRAGGIDVLAAAGAHSVTVEVQRVRDSRPELLLFAPCGFDVERAEREGRALLASPAWKWAEGVEAWALDGNALTSRPGPRLADAVEVMAAIIAPQLFPPPPAHYARRLSAAFSSGVPAAANAQSRP
jgi:iron complex transport system substrate-binding protein